jgi:hypothetical protein
MSHIQKCPQCGGDVLDGYCYSCGIELPKVTNSEPQAAHHEPQNTYNGQQTAYNGQQASYNSQQAAYTGQQTAYTGQQAAYSEPQTVYPNIKVTDDIIYEKPIPEDFFTGYNKMNFGEKLAKYWWFVLLSVLLPAFWLIPAVIAGVSLISYKKEKVRFILELFALAGVGLLFLG